MIIILSTFLVQNLIELSTVSGFQSNKYMNIIPFVIE